MGFANGFGLICVSDIGPIWVTYQIHIMGPMPIPFAKPMKMSKAGSLQYNYSRVRFL